MTQTNGHQKHEPGSLGEAIHLARGKGKSPTRELFHKFAHATATATGTPVAFIFAMLAVIVWACLGPVFHFSDTWQLVINTSTTIVTFLMVFLIQNTQNRDARAMHLKIDELIRSKKGARNTLVDLENCSDEELEHIEREFKRVRARASTRADGMQGREDNQTDRQE